MEAPFHDSYTVYLKFLIHQSSKHLNATTALIVISRIRKFPLVKVCGKIPYSHQRAPTLERAPNLHLPLHHELWSVLLPPVVTLVQTAFRRIRLRFLQAATICWSLTANFKTAFTLSYIIATTSFTSLPIYESMIKHVVKCPFLESMIELQFTLC